ncbi:hypothetical protein Bca101_043424 [Brassica carinata]
MVVVTLSAVSVIDLGFGLERIWFAASTVIPCLLIRLLWSFLLLRFQASERRLLLSHASLDALRPGSFVLCSYGGTGVRADKPPLPPASTPPMLHSPVFSASVWIPRVRTCRPCFACPLVRVALGMVCGPSDRSPVVFSNDPCDFESAKLQSLPYGRA